TFPAYDLDFAVWQVPAQVSRLINLSQQLTKLRVADQRLLLAASVQIALCEVRRADTNLAEFSYACELFAGIHHQQLHPVYAASYRQPPLFARRDSSSRDNVIPHRLRRFGGAVKVDAARLWRQGLQLLHVALPQGIPTIERVPEAFE